MLIGLAVAGKPGGGKINAAALLGGFMPDFMLYALILHARFWQGHDLKTIFDTLYFSPLWESLLAPGNSFALWGILLAGALWFKKPWMKAFALAGFVHLLFDLPVHHDDAHMHFWPLTDWVFISPVSYWDSAHYGSIISVFEGAGLMALAVYLWRIHKTPAIRLLVAILAPSLFLMHVFYMIAFAG